jgi:HTH-type transcriptional regulator, glycine betaine synthesis regulator
MSDSPLRESELLAAEAVGEVIEYWGFRKVLGRVWTALYLSSEPLSAGVVGERLSMSAGAVSMSLNELQRWGVVRRVWLPGERREFFEAETDLWKMISKVINERERFLASAVKGRLERAAEVLRAAPQTAETRARLERVKHLLDMASMAEKVIEMFVRSRKADFSSFGDVLELPRTGSSPPGPRARKPR